MTEYEALWQRYLELFKENTRLTSLLQKGDTMNDVQEVTEVGYQVPEDHLSQQMAEAVAVHSPGGEHPIIDVETETPVEVEHVYIQADQEIGGVEVKD